jgi:hypothetical protein
VLDIGITCDERSNTATAHDILKECKLCRFMIRATVSPSSGFFLKRQKSAVGHDPNPV